jgi:hypothetical protein
MDTARMGQAISLIGLNLHILLEGDRYDLHNKVAKAAAQPDR